MSASSHRGGIAAAWSVLIGMGGTSVTYNVYHAVTHGQMVLALALLYGIAPVFAAACLSHIVAVHDGGWFMRATAFGVMLGAMSLSIGATASVVAPASGHLRWLFGGVLDAAALVALRVILDRREREADAASALEDAGQRAAAAESETAALRAELAAARAELDAAAATTTSARNPARTSGRKSSASSGRKPARARRPASARTQTVSSAPEPGDEADDLTTEAQALNILAADPGISGSELGRQLGKSDRYGRDLLKRLSAAEAEPSSAQGE